MLQILIILVGIFLRLMPHVPNFTPITAVALFGGVYLNKKYAIFLPLIIMFISDFLISPNNMFHSTTLFVYGSFIVSGIIGLTLRSRKKPIIIFAGTLLASLQFFLITNFGTWATTNMYPHTFGGLIESYIMGIPFYRWTLLGDLFYTTTFFILYETSLRIIKQFFPRGILHVQNDHKQL